MILANPVVVNDLEPDETPDQKNQRNLPEMKVEMTISWQSPLLSEMMMQMTRGPYEKHQKISQRQAFPNK